MYRVPPINHKHKICVICEGDEDFCYFKRLIELSVWNERYEFIPKNAHGESNIPSLYSSIYQNDSYEAVLVFCDTDKAPHKQYRLMKKKLVDFHGGSSGSKLIEKIVIFANPCTMQVILLHFGAVELKNQGKKTNSALIEELTGIVDYDAHENQIKELCSKIFRKNYEIMKDRVAMIDKPDTESASTNFIKFINLFESNDIGWIKSTRDYLDKRKN